MGRRAFIFLIAFLLPLSLQARGGHGGHSSYSHRSSHSYRSSGSHSRTRSHGSSRHSGGVVHTYRSARHHSYASRDKRFASGVGKARTKPSEATTSQQKNLATCLSGKARSACDHSLLEPAESKRVEAAERRANFKTCLSGTSASSCDRSLLTPRQLEQVSQAEKRSSDPEAAPADTHPTGRGYRNSRGERVPSPMWTKNGQAPSGASAQCADGSYSFSRSRRGTCSHHGGVARWL
jgi:hypothetical protein